MVQWEMNTRNGISIYGIPVMHTWQDLFFLNCILQYYPFDVIVELGTYVGGVTLFFALNSNAEVYTFDIRPEPTSKRYLQIDEVLPIIFCSMDVRSSSTVDFVRGLIDKRRALIYCDDGAKIKEFNLYAPTLKEEDIIMAHDKGREIRDEDISEAIIKYHLKPFHQEKADMIGADIYSFRREEN